MVIKGKKIFAILLLISMFMMVACSNSSQEGKKQSCQDLEFEIVEDDEVPQKIKEKVFEKKEKKYAFTFGNGKEVYVVLGYGAQPTGGYSVKVISVQDCGENITVTTELIQPSKEEVVARKKTYPGIVLKMKDLEKEVIFKMD